MLAARQEAWQNRAFPEVEGVLVPGRVCIFKNVKNSLNQEKLKLKKGEKKIIVKLKQTSEKERACPKSENSGTTNLK